MRRVIIVLVGLACKGVFFNAALGNVNEDVRYGPIYIVQYRSCSLPHRYHLKSRCPVPFELTK